MNNKGKYVKVNKTHPNAVGVCDRSGFVFNHKDLCKQYEWRGNRLVWTGFLVGRPFLDKPQQQFRPPLTKADPYSIKNPRFPENYIGYETNPLDKRTAREKLDSLVWNV